jgi:hypothetical protein
MAVHLLMFPPAPLVQPVPLALLVLPDRDRPAVLPGL